MSKKSAWLKENKQEVLTFCDKYIEYLNKCKTERLCTSESEKIAIENGFVNIESKINLIPGDKVYRINRGKNIVLAVIGNNDIKDGTNIVAAHIDSPRLDLKPNPLYEDSNLALLKTHYYGGIKKYQWTTIPLSLIGIVVKEDGEIIDVNIGENDNDPKFTVTDLLPHLAQDQMSQTGSKIIAGEDLNIVIGSMPAECEKSEFKQTILDILKTKYNIEEEDFISAELEAVPSFKACTIGLDLSMVGAYGQDDRVCAYTSLKAICGVNKPTRTCICYLADKEETGSDGNTGTQSRFFENFIAELLYKTKENYNEFDLKTTLSNSMCLSSDVTAAVDPTYKSVTEEKNSAFFGNGVALCKYTGSRGKSSTSDANAEFVAKIRNILNKADISWQICELGKVDQGGGGTVAKYIANLNVDTLDIGVPLLSMHAPLEVASKADIYSAYKSYIAFLNA